ncbi:MAG: Mut7-C RNAse domain-containing protein [Candidatus Odinarchaeia archaeon]
MNEKIKNKLSFICDDMLGRLNKWLRVLGYDSLFSNTYTDDELLSLLIENDDRILLTRDKNLYLRALKHNRKALFIQDQEIVKQLAYLKKKLNINLKVQPDISRCSFCNTPLKKVNSINKFKALIPPKLRNRRKFWYCSKCNKIFWKGRMWPNIIELPMRALKASLTKNEKEK